MAKRRRPSKATKDDSTGKAPDTTVTVSEGTEAAPADSSKADTWTADDDETVPDAPNPEAIEDVIDADTPIADLAEETAAFPDTEAETPDEVEEAAEADAETADDTPEAAETEAATSQDTVEAAQPDVETAAEPEPEPEPEIETAPPAPVVKQKRPWAFLPMVLGGICAGGIGFYVALMLDPAVSRSDFESAHTRIDGIEDTLANLPEPEMPVIPDPVDLGPLETALAAQGEDLKATLDGQASALSDLSVRVDLLATQPEADGTLPAAAFDAALNKLSAAADEQRATIDAALKELQDAVQAQQAELDALVAKAQAVQDANETAAQAAIARGAVAQIGAALDSGAPFDAALATLSDTGLVDVPAALVDTAADGVALLSELQSSIADEARSALGAAREASDDGGLGAFFERQLGGRSVVPREGSDPDAILSRVEAAVKAGDLHTAISESAGLPPEAQAALGPWLDQAQQRHEAVTAANALAQRLSAL